MYASWLIYLNSVLENMNLSEYKCRFSVLIDFFIDYMILHRPILLSKHRELMFEENLQF